MEVEKKQIVLEKRESDIIYSNSIRAGRRIYYLDVKKSRNDDLYLAITESKKRVNTKQDNQNPSVSYEKHKIFLYKEDFNSFMEGLEDVIGFIKKEQGEAMTREEYYASLKDENDELADDIEETSAETLETEDEVSEEPKRSFFDKFKF